MGRVSDDFHFIQFYIIKSLQYEPATLFLGISSRQIKANVHTKKIHTCSDSIVYNTPEGSQTEKHKYHVILLICGN